MLRYATSISAVLLAGSALAQQDMAPQTADEWFAQGQATLQQMLTRQPNANRAKNVILMVSDGNGVGTNYATRLFAGQQQGLMGEEYVLPYETPDWTSALVKTYNINAQTPDSAPTAGAMNSGVKQLFNTINLTPVAIWDDCGSVEGNELPIFSEMVEEMGKSVGVVSTARITHATPAAVYARTANRNWEDSVPEGCTAQADIATQLIRQMEEGTIDLAMGGGRRHFVPEGQQTDEGGEGRRADGVNLIDRAREAGAQYAWNTETFNQLNLDGETPTLALFEDSHMEYEYDRADVEEPSIVDMTRAAIDYLSQDEDGFFLEIEAGRVDHANHAGNAYRTMTDNEAFAEAVRVADEMTNDADTLIIVTADHEHAIAFNGYCGRGSPVLGLCYEVSSDQTLYAADTPNLGADDKPYTVIGYLNGPGSVLVEQPEGGFSGERQAMTNEQATDPEYLQQALIPMSSETHSGEDVAVYAKGPFAHLFDSTVEQNYIFHVMHHAVNAPQQAAEAGAGREITAQDVLPIAKEAREDATESMATVPDDAESGVVGQSVDQGATAN